MTDNGNGLVKVRRALISVSDKTGIVEFARTLSEFHVEIISTGGTAKALRSAGLAVRDVSDVTGFPEMMDGRIKTLHPGIHGGLLALRDNDEHLAAMREHGIEPIDMVVVNLYPFEQTINKPDVTLDEAIEQIDIGGPAMIRSAAKNWRSVAVIVDTKELEAIAQELSKHHGALPQSRRLKLASRAFAVTARYDLLIAAYLTQTQVETETAALAQGAGTRIGGGGSANIFTFTSSGFEETPPLETDAEVSIEDFHPIERLDRQLPDRASWTIAKKADLRYGENPHQIAALYQTRAQGGLTNGELLSGKEMSFNNYVDADAAWQLVCDFDDLACAIIKHTNPAGVAIGSTPEEAYRRALACDPVSAFGGIVAFNRKLDEAAARAAVEIFTEVVIAPEIDAGALEILKTKKNLRVLRAGQPTQSQIECKQISGGMLVQTRDTHKLKREDLKLVTKRAPTDQQIDDLLLAWTVCKHTKSNAIVYARDWQTVGVGAGQMSRVDSVKIGAMRARLPIAGSVLASDAFFPFRDNIDEAAGYGVAAVIQPGGSVRDAEVIAACDEHQIAMVLTGVRHFKH